MTKKGPYELPFVGQLVQRLQEPNPLIQVIVGSRQVGKTTGLLQCLKKLTQPWHYATSEELLSPTPIWIEEQWQKALQIDSAAILALDEIQKVPQWSHVVKKLWENQKVTKKSRLKLVLLGSSSLWIHKGIHESLAGRFELIRVSHWNLFETNQIRPMSLDDYLLYGGYPGSYGFVDSPERWRAYLKESIVEAAIGKDILEYAAIRSPALFRQAFEILCSYPAQEISYNKLLGQLQERGNIDLVKNYLHHYQAAFLITTLEKYSQKSILTKSSSPKILPLCPALVTFAIGPEKAKMMKGHLFEMAVGCELMRLFDRIFYWREGPFEVDFVVGNLLGIEVKSGRRKSSQGLEMFRKKYPKASLLFVTPENFPLLSAQGKTFIEKASG